MMKIDVRSLLIKFHWILSSQFGIDPVRLFWSLRDLPRFFSTYWEFRGGYDGSLVLMPCLHDRYEEGGTTNSEYFWQDLLVARWIHAAAPEKHLDIGSRVDGFVAHVASFREIEVLDVRPITMKIPGVLFCQADLMDATSFPAVAAGGGYCDSLSCLHALEHFGLGRYGDPINPQGYRKGFENMAKLLQAGGTFYLSTPIGRERVEFNANWVFEPGTILQLASSVSMRVIDFWVYNPKDGIRRIDIEKLDQEVLALGKDSYHLGIFVFTKTA